MAEILDLTMGIGELKWIYLGCFLVRKEIEKEMFSKNFMKSYISFISMSLTVAIVGSAYLLLTNYLATFVSEDYRQALAVVLGVFAVSLGYKMMSIIEANKDQVIEDAEKMADRY